MPLFCSVALSFLPRVCMVYANGLPPTFSITGSSLSAIPRRGRAASGQNGVQIGRTTATIPIAAIRFTFIKERSFRHGGSMLSRRFGSAAELLRDSSFREAPGRIQSRRATRMPGEVDGRWPSSSKETLSANSHPIILRRRWRQCPRFRYTTRLSVLSDHRCLSPSST